MMGRKRFGARYRTKHPTIAYRLQGVRMLLCPTMHRERRTWTWTGMDRNSMGGENGSRERSIFDEC